MIKPGTSKHGQFQPPNRGDGLLSQTGLPETDRKTTRDARRQPQTLGDIAKNLQGPMKS